MPIPRFVDLHTSNACNHKCVGCAYSGELDTDFMKEDQHIKIINDLMDFGVRAFDFAGGGEPLFLPYIESLFDLVHSRNGHFGVITNGSLLTERLMEKIVKYATYIRISLEASNVESFVKYKRVSGKEWNNKIFKQNIFLIFRLLFLRWVNSFTLLIG